MTNVVCFGDSITYGEHVDPSLRWTSILQRRYPDHTMINSGRCGETTVQAFSRVHHDLQQPLYLGGPGGIAIIQFGHNDSNRWLTDQQAYTRTSPRAFTDTLIDYISRSRFFGASHVALITPHYCPDRPADYKRDLAHFADLVRRARGGAHLFDFYTSFARSIPLDETRTLLLDENPSGEDNLHLSPKGHSYYAEVIGDWLDLVI